MARNEPASNDAIVFFCTCRTPIRSRNHDQTRSTEKRNPASKNRVSNTTTVARFNSSFDDHETLVISASVAIKKSANRGQLYSRNSIQPQTASMKIGTPYATVGGLLRPTN